MYARMATLDTGVFVGDSLMGEERSRFLNCLLASISERPVMEIAILPGIGLDDIIVGAESLKALMIADGIESVASVVVSAANVSDCPER